MRAGQQLEAFSTTFGLVASVSLHVAAFAYITSATAHFDFDFELILPAEVEFGLTDGMAMSAPTPPPPAATGRIQSWTQQDRPGDEGTVDAGVAFDADTDTDAGTDTDPGTGADTDSVTDSVTDTDSVADSAADTDAVTDPPPVAPSTLTGPSRIPPGAQLALRIDMKRIRESPLGPDVTSFLKGVPDWQLLLQGSGIDPVDDLDRLLVATPNLQRSRLVLAGRHRRDQSFARNSVKRLARSRGKSVRWRKRQGVATAQWYNLDPTPRTIALLSPHHFSITRRQDLERLLAMAQARELRDPEKEGLVAARGPDVLLSMGPEEAVSLEVEGVHRFQDAREASVYWKKVATFYSQQLIMTLAGFGKPLRRMEFKPEDDRVQVSFKLSADQIRFILSYAEGRLRGAGGATHPRRPSERAPTQTSPTKKGP
jgi:hypothetical protein